MWVVWGKLEPRSIERWGVTRIETVAMRGLMMADLERADYG